MNKTKEFYGRVRDILFVISHVMSKISSRTSLKDSGWLIGKSHNPIIRYDSYKGRSTDLHLNFPNRYIVGFGAK